MSRDNCFAGKGFWGGINLGRGNSLGRVVVAKRDLSDQGGGGQRVKADMTMDEKFPEGEAVGAD